MFFESSTERLYITGSTYGEFFDPTFSNGGAHSSECFVATLQLPSIIDPRGPLWLMKHTMGLSNVTAACSALTVRQMSSGTRRYRIIGHSIRSLDILVSNVSTPKRDTFGMLMEMTYPQGGELSGSYLFDSDTVQYPITLMDSGSYAFYSVVVHSNQPYASSPYELWQEKQRVITQEPDPSAAEAFLPPFLGSGFNVTLVKLTEPGTQTASSTHGVPSLTSVWSQDLVASPNKTFYASGLLELSGKELLVTGFTSDVYSSESNSSSNGTVEGIFTVMNSRNGDLMRSSSLRSLLGKDGSDYILGLCANNSTTNEVYVVGMTNSSSALGNSASSFNATGNRLFRAFVAKVEMQAFHILWSYELGALANAGTSSQYYDGVQGTSCALTPDGQFLYIGGTVKAGAVLTLDGTSPAGEAAGRDDIFVAQLMAQNGILVYAKQIGTSQDDRLVAGQGILSDDDGNAIVMANTRGSFFRQMNPSDLGMTNDLVIFTVNKTSGDHVPMVRQSLPFQQGSPQQSQQANGAFQTAPNAAQNSTNPPLSQQGAEVSQNTSKAKQQKTSSKSPISKKEINVTGSSPQSSEASNSKAGTSSRTGNAANSTMHNIQAVFPSSLSSRAKSSSPSEGPASSVAPTPIVSLKPTSLSNQTVELQTHSIRSHLLIGSIAFIALVLIGSVNGLVCMRLHQRRNKELSQKVSDGLIGNATCQPFLVLDDDSSASFLESGKIDRSICDDGTGEPYEKRSFETVRSLPSPSGRDLEDPDTLLDLESLPDFSKGFQQKDDEESDHYTDDEQIESSSDNDEDCAHSGYYMSPISSGLQKESFHHKEFSNRKQSSKQSVHLKSHDEDSLEKPFLTDLSWDQRNSYDISIEVPTLNTNDLAHIDDKRCDEGFRYERNRKQRKTSDRALYREISSKHPARSTRKSKRSQLTDDATPLPTNRLKNGEDSETPRRDGKLRKDIKSKTKHRRRLSPHRDIRDRTDMATGRKDALEKLDRISRKHASDLERISAYIAGVRAKKEQRKAAATEMANDSIACAGLPSSPPSEESFAQRKERYKYMISRSPDQEMHMQPIDTADSAELMQKKANANVKASDEDEDISSAQKASIRVKNRSVSWSLEEPSVIKVPADSDSILKGPQSIPSDSNHVFVSDNSLGAPSNQQAMCDGEMTKGKVQHYTTMASQSSSGNVAGGQTEHLPFAPRVQSTRSSRERDMNHDEAVESTRQTGEDGEASYEDRYDDTEELVFKFVKWEQNERLSI